ncbi:cell adhesion molecule 2 [Eurytemora carolleeae]|uniref:cell adhesion molecule 2 n=1 Tax=Eurytemora carolleeae TaxID=1294199 RepID=UPI000C76D8E4|nr:cell adhesion molecule 2 [Eurytemora carolleeae]|eukprot:XP_023321546.1 cell adhesion molecule 2-like [Eurytemora affinis]
MLLVDPPEGPIIHGYSSSTVYKEGDLINITCQALGGNPSPTVFWFKGVNNTKEDIPFHKQDDGTYSNLELRATSAEHGSTYTCHAWNNITQISLPSIPIYLNISFSTDVVLLEGPDFVELGKSIQLTCSVRINIV